jgi:hypothetical protein
MERELELVFIKKQFMLNIYYEMLTGIEETVACFIGYSVQRTVSSIGCVYYWCTFTEVSGPGRNHAFATHKLLRFAAF